MPLQSITPSQASAFEKLKAALQPDVKDFACRGVVPADRLDIRELVLYFDGQDGSLNKLPFPLPENDEESALKVLLDAAVPSSFGRGDKDVLDPEYRLAKEIKPPKFGTSPDLLSCSGLLSILNAQLLPGVALRAKPNKINIYGKGGFFKAHRDTPKSSDHVGTITFCLPPRFSGGELVVRHAGETLTCNWADEVMGAEGPKAAWAFLFSDCEHEVLPVLSGNRITIAFDVYVDSKPVTDLVSFSRFENRQATVSAALQATMQTEALRSAGAYIGLALSHDYPRDVLAREKGGPPVATLKGVDAMLVKAIEAAGYKWKYVAVHETWENFGDFEDELEVSDSVWSYEGHNEQYGDIEDVEIDVEIIWVKSPQTYPVESSYVAYGNEAELVTKYSTWAITVFIP